IIPPGAIYRRNRRTPKTHHVCIISAMIAVAAPKISLPENSNQGKQRREAMENKEPRQINEFKVMDEHGNDYTVVEYQNVTETRSLKWRRAGPSWFGLAENPIDLGPNLVCSQRALAAIRAGSRIYVGTGCAAPRTLVARLEAMEPGPADLEFVSFLTTSALPQVAGAPQTRYRHRAFFVGSEVRGLAGSGQLDYVPISLAEIP